MRVRWAVVVLLLVPVFTGCIGTTTEDVGQQSAPVDTGPENITAAGEQVFEDPQTDAHPAFDFPTFTTLPEDPPAEAPHYWQPIPKNNFTVDDLSVEVVGEDPNDASPGTGIALFGQVAIIPGRGTGNTWVYDISDPENPELLSEFSAPGRDVDTVAFPDGSLYAAFATDQGVVPVWDLTNPEDPKKVATIEPERGSHNVGFVPGTPILYNSASLGGGTDSGTGVGNVPDTAAEGTAIYDLSDPANPERIQDFENGYSCHDITFSIREDSDEYRAYCAGIDMTQIWDIEDPENPEVVVNVPVHHGVAGAPSTSVPILRFSHLAIASQGGDVLVVGDETGGGLAPACDATVSQGPQTVSGPVGNLYFYDISDEENPQLMSWMSTDNPALATDEVAEDPTRAAGTCTSHFGRLIPSEDKNLLAIGFYARGVNIVDFTDPANPEIVQQYNDGTDVWDTWFYNGYLVTGDGNKGMEILELSAGS